MHYRVSSDNGEKEMEREREHRTLSTESNLFPLTIQSFRQGVQYEHKLNKYVFCNKEIMKIERGKGTSTNYIQLNALIVIIH